MSKRKLLSALFAAAFSAVTFSAVAGGHSVPAKPDDATTNAESSEARRGMVKPMEDQPKAKKGKKRHKKSKKAVPKAGDAPAAQ